MKSKRWLRVGGVFGLVGLGLSPLFKSPPVADDLQFLTVGSGLLRNRGIMSVASDWFAEGLKMSSAHFSPIGGVVSALHVWIVNQLTFRTPLSLVDSWSLLRVTWIVLAIAAAAFLTKEFLKSWANTNLPPFVLLSIAGLVTLSNLQVHVLWSNDPVVSYPVAAWSTAILGLLYLAHLLHFCGVRERRRRHALISIAIAVVGVLSYELMLSYLVAGLLYLAWYFWVVRRDSNISLHDVLIRALGALVGLSVLVPVLLFKILKGTMSYGGTDVSVSSGLGPRQLLTANLPWLPLANLGRSLETLPTRVTDWSSVSFTLLACSGLVVLIYISTAKRETYNFTHGVGTAVVILGFIPGVVATLILLSTSKYQSELSGGLGSVYTNYAMFVGGIAFVGTSLFVSLKLRPIARGSLLLFLTVLSCIQWSVNSWSLNEIRSTRKWAFDLVNQLDAPSSNLGRCKALDLLKNQSFPDYYVFEISSSLQSAHQATHGTPYCDYNRLSGYSGVDGSLSGENYTIEYLPDGRRAWWMYGRASVLRVDFAKPRSKFSLKLEFGNVPCGTARSLLLRSVLGETKIELGTSSSTVILKSPLNIGPMSSLSIAIEIQGPECQVSSDPRTFTGQVFFPSLVVESSSD